jgi:DNA-binding transcriptional ArsR family regulator
MSEVNNKQLMKVYNGNEVIAGAGFTMQSNYIVPLLTRMKNEGLISASGSTLIQTILSYKHTEENPYPSIELLMQVLDYSKSTVKKGLASIKDTGLVPVVKQGRKNTYDFTPFFELLTKFIEEFKKKNFVVKVADLIKKKVVRKKSETDFSKLKKGEETVIIDTNEATEEEVIEEAVVPALPEKIEKVLLANKVSEQDQEAVAELYAIYSGDLDDRLFIQKIVTSAQKKNFIKFFSTCITNAYANNEQPQEAPVQSPYKSKGTSKPTRTEMLPNWFDGETGEVVEQVEIKTSTEELMFQANTLEELLAIESECLADPELVETFTMKKNLLSDRQDKKEGVN